MFIGFMFLKYKFCWHERISLYENSFRKGSVDSYRSFVEPPHGIIFEFL